MKISQLTDHILTRRVTHEGYSRRSVTLINRCVVALVALPRGTAVGFRILRDGRSLARG